MSVSIAKPSHETEYEYRRRVFELTSSARCLQAKLETDPQADRLLWRLYVARATKATVEWANVLEELSKTDRKYAKCVKGDAKLVNLVRRNITLWHSFTSVLAEAEQAYKRCDIDKDDRMLQALRDDAFDKLEAVAAKVDKAMRG